MNELETKIGEAAGEVYRALQDNGPQREKDLEDAVAIPNSLILQGLGWLAREGKICRGEPCEAQTTYVLQEETPAECCQEE